MITCIKVCFSKLFAFTRADKGSIFTFFLCYSLFPLSYSVVQVFISCYIFKPSVPCILSLVLLPVGCFLDCTQLCLSLNTNDFVENRICIHVVYVLPLARRWQLQESPTAQCIPSIRGSNRVWSGSSMKRRSLINSTPYWLLLKSLSPRPLPLPPLPRLVNSEQLIGHDCVYVPAS